MQFTFTSADINIAAESIWEVAKHKKVWAFYAAMGSGKTTFIHALCDVLQVTSTVGSPTYSIINEYSSEEIGIVYHMDWYRLKDEEEALQAGVEDTLLTGKLCLVEWPEKAEALLPAETLKIRIAIIDEDTRQITLEL
jgi:tRNA threonylcarbamoyladenosine biosynthesis protein TsaE